MVCALVSWGNTAGAMESALLECLLTALLGRLHQSHETRATHSYAPASDNMHVLLTNLGARGRRDVLNDQMDSMLPP